MGPASPRPAGQHQADREGEAHDDYMIMIIMMMVQMKPENLGQSTEKEKELKKGGAQ